MGYSTTHIDLEKAKQLVKNRKMVCTEWSTGIPRNNLARALSSSISDHNPPRIYFGFKNDQFACYEEGYNDGPMETVKSDVIQENIIDIPNIKIYF